MMVKLNYWINSMSVMWKYLDKRSATIAAIKDFDSMAFIITDTERQIKKANEKLGSTGGMKLDAQPSVHDPKAGEKQILAVVDQINILEERYREALEYMEWFKPAWSQMTDEEKYILKSFYSENNYGCNAVYEISEKLSVEQPTVYKRKNRALSKLTVLLFGKG